MVRIAAKQFGVISLEQLLTIGFSLKDIYTRERRCVLHRIHKDVFAVGHTRIVPHARLVAALLTSGSTSFLSHKTAAAVWGVQELTISRIHVTLPTNKALHREGLVVHRTRHEPDPADVTTRNGLRVSSVPRLLIEQAQQAGPAELDRLITQAVRKQVLDLAAVEDALRRHARRPGVANLKRALREYRPRRDRKSDLERAFDKLLATAPDIPAPARNVIIDGWEIDCYWPHARLAVELDGRPYHTAVKDSERDKLKDAKLLRLGIRTMRITDVRFRVDAQGILADLRSLTSERRAA
jgi:very-short-patch-repair endonuclease